MHRQTAATRDGANLLRLADLDAVLVCRTWRTVTHSLGVSWKGTLLLLEPTPLARSLTRKKVEVVEHPDGRLSVQSGTISLAFSTIMPAPFVRHAVAAGDIVDSKQLTPVLAALRAQQAVHADMVHAAGG